ncbi:gamma-glutamyltransferase [Robiginitalea sp. IMCC43444]|uniref:gamma-glutamyltransferase n=1 Tax=Robiginitalea sp. IMCC43444 TaxID=3459121 RepID=UPI0040421F25
MKRILVSSLLVLLISTIAAIVAGLSFRVALGAAAEQYPARAAYAPNGAVVSSNDLDSQAGLAVLQRGGNAVDAAVTAAAVLGVVEPFMSGLGGDMFAIFWSADEERLV